MIDPALLVAVPLAGSALPAVASRLRPRTGWPLALGVLLVQSVLAVWVAAAALAGDPVRTQVAGIPAPFGIGLLVDALSAPFVVLIALAALAVLAYTRRGGPRSGAFYSLYLLLIGGLTGVCVTTDVFNLYVFLEISGLASYGMVAQADRGAAALAALKYLLVGTVGASLYLFGVGYAYVATGTLDMAALRAALPAASDPLALAALGLMVLGLSVKVALFPLHTWKPDAYEAAPPGVAALLAALASTVAAYALGRLLLAVFPGVAEAVVDAALLGLAAASIVAGSLLAYRSESVARLLAYSSLAQFGIVVVGFVVATPTAIAGSVVHLIGHAVMKAGSFLVVGLLARTHDVRTVAEYAGLARRSPYVSAGFAVLALGLIGIPPTVGFAGKFYIALGAIEAGSWTAAALVLASTLFGLVYLGRVLERMYVGEGDTHAGPTGAASPGMYAAVAVAVLATLALGGVGPLVEGWLAPVLDGLDAGLAMGVVP
ncbi:proton-conducting transporter transmembrane domain-containing protein [Halapricum hydrolyticum]|uniref:Proton-conducting transporter membrane subunit n=1 Tax=Halapricum hydrolyticum TaxID=2979991 RepID=A0AAE3IFV5_9EURY|nr:proton-conducting transporter membrane subunit [Halapricum hydrolyticum]MCU4718773.1 proton-conducting transporter membrane subunit [Halapricum hydrolyticum]MCU4727819.1 proton-conducting transporter membrane subunit [Halapricum hydrolyticum]